MKESHGSRFETGSYAFTKAESLLEMIVNFDGFHPDPIQEKKVVPIPPVKQDHITPLPGTPSFLVLTSSFCGSVKRLPSCQEESAGFDLTTPLGRLRVEGNNEHENFFLRHYLVNGLGSEGLKDLVALIDVYRMLSFNHAQAQNIEISTKQLLQRLGKGQHAADRGEQLRLISTALYLSRATVTHISSQPVQIPPVLVLEGIQTDNRGNIWLSYHLSEEIFNAIYEHKSPLYVVPASRIVEYHSVRDYRVLLLTFFLGNRLVQGSCSCYFATLGIQSGLLSYGRIIPGEKNRLRDVQQIIFALLQLEAEEFIRLDSHPELDLVLAIIYLEEASERKEKLFSDLTLQRLEPQILALQGLSRFQLRTQRRKAIKHLLQVDPIYENREEEFPEWGSRITIHSGAQFEKNHRHFVEKLKNTSFSPAFAISTNSTSERIKGGPL